MERNKQYQAIKVLIEAGHITEFRQIFEHIYPTHVARDMGIHYTRFTKMIDRVQDFRVSELYRVAGFIGIAGIKILQLVDAQYEAEKKRKK
jgi:hypothetical protein